MVQESPGVDPLKHFTSSQVKEIERTVSKLAYVASGNLNKERAYELKEH